jgi:U3 small nucleolar ribonucleoprotein protein LCP5
LIFEFPKKKKKDKKSCRTTDHIIKTTMTSMDTTITRLLHGLTASVESALPALPTSETILPPANGITLLDAKNDLFLCYLQTLALRNLAVIRSAKAGKSLAGDLDKQLVRDLVKHRVYLERGVRPLEERLKYQIDKVVRAAEDQARRDIQKAVGAAKPTASTRINKDEDEDQESESGSASDDDDDGLAFRPNPSALTRPTDSSTPTTHPSRTTTDTNDAIYRPPRINATLMPAPPSPSSREKSSTTRTPMRSNTIDEYVADELSSAPTAQPSIGSTIAGGGRRDKSARERREEAERTAYEESNLVRLPKDSKKVLAKKNARNVARGGFGGEEWDQLGQGISRIERLTRKGERSSGAGGGVGGALERSRKRKLDGELVVGSRAGASSDMGREFERRKKRTMRRA